MTSIQKIIKYCAIVFAVFLTVSIIGGIVGVISSVSFFVGDDISGDMQKYSISGNIKNLDLDINASSLKIVCGDRFGVESNHKDLLVREKEGKLSISEEKMGLRNYAKAKLIVTIPENSIFEDVAISTGAGKVSVDTLCANTIYLNFGAGEVDIKHLSALSRAEIDGGAGELTIRGGELHNLNMDMGIGELNLESRLTGKSKLDYGIGETKLSLIGKKEDYQIELDKGIGSANLDGKAMSDDSIYGDVENRISIDGGIGSIKILFKN